MVTVLRCGWTRAASSLAKLDLVGVAEIALMLGATRQRVDAIVRTHEDFPEPVAELSAGRIWLRRDVEEWARRSGRLL